MVDQYEDTTIELTDVGFTFAGSETEAASTNIWIPHAEVPQGISVNVVSNESTLSLIGQDVIRECGLVIDHHYHCVHGHIMKRYIPSAILPTGRLASEMMPSKSEQGQRPTWSHALAAFRWGQQPRAQETGTLSLESSKKRSQNTSTNTHPRVKTTC